MLNNQFLAVQLTLALYRPALPFRGLGHWRPKIETHKQNATEHQNVLQLRGLVAPKEWRTFIQGSVVVWVILRAILRGLSPTTATLSLTASWPPSTSLFIRYVHHACYSRPYDTIAFALSSRPQDRGDHSGWLLAHPLGITTTLREHKHRQQEVLQLRLPSCWVHRLDKLQC